MNKYGQGGHRKDRIRLNRDIQPKTASSQKYLEGYREYYPAYYN